MTSFLVCLSLIGSACTNGAVTDDEDTTTAPTGAEATVGDGPIENCEPISIESLPVVNESVDLGEFHFAYAPDYVMVPESQVEASLELMAELGIEPVEATVDVVLGVDDERGDDPSAAAARECLENVLQIYAVGEPLEVALAMRSENPQLLIAPIQAMGEAVHSGYKAPTEPEELDPSALDSFSTPGDAGSDADLAAVVDSGIYPETPGLSGNVEFTQGLDLEPADGHSHGTFVSSIIRQLAQDHRITFARAPARPLQGFLWSDDPGDLELPDLTTELDVAEAILRLVHRHQNEPDRVKSLNLSLGAYSPMPNEDLWMVTTFLALDLWAQTFPDSTVFAAGGNDDQVDPLLPLWPGALDTVTAVGALNDNGDPAEIVWDDTGNEQIWANIPASAPRFWIDELAPGSMLVNYTQPDVLAYWSGSSFATAVANGLHLRGETPIPPHRGDIQGLTYWDGNQVQPGP